VFLRLTISPSPNSEDIKRDLDLWALTQYTLRELKGKLHKDIEYVGAVHADHSSVRHVNLLLLIPGRIPRQEFFALPKFLREKAKIEAQKQRELLDPMPKMEGAHTVLRQDPRVNPRSQAFEPRNFRSSHYLALTCPDCCTNQRLWKTSFSEYFCSNCHSRFAPSVFGGLTRREELSL
jgi:ribosomal protein S27E